MPTENTPNRSAANGEVRHETPPSSAPYVSEPLQQVQQQLEEFPITVNEGLDNGALMHQVWDNLSQMNLLLMETMQYLQVLEQRPSFQKNLNIAQ